MVNTRLYAIVFVWKTYSWFIDKFAEFFIIVKHQFHAPISLYIRYLTSSPPVFCPQLIPYIVLPTWPVDLFIHGQPTHIDLPNQWSVLNPFPTLRPSQLTSGSSYPWSTHGQWSSISVVCPQPLPQHYVLPNWPMDLLIHGQPTDIDLPYQWSVLNPFPTLRPPKLTNGSSYPWSTHGHWSSMSVVCPQPLPNITSSQTDQWIFLSMVNPQILIFHISGHSCMFFIIL